MIGTRVLRLGLGLLVAAKVRVRVHDGPLVILSAVERHHCLVDRHLVVRIPVRRRGVVDQLHQIQRRHFAHAAMDFEPAVASHDTRDLGYRVQAPVVLTAPCTIQAHAQQHRQVGLDAVLREWQ